MQEPPVTTIFGTFLLFRLEFACVDVACVLFHYSKINCQPKQNRIYFFLYHPLVDPHFQTSPTRSNNRNVHDPFHIKISSTNRASTARNQFYCVKSARTHLIHKKKEEKNSSTNSHHIHFAFFFTNYNIIRESRTI